MQDVRVILSCFPGEDEGGSLPSETSRCYPRKDWQEGHRGGLQASRDGAEGVVNSLAAKKNGLKIGFNVLNAMLSMHLPYSPKEPLCTECSEMTALSHCNSSSNIAQYNAAICWRCPG